MIFTRTIMINICENHYNENQYNDFHNKHLVICKVLSCVYSYFFKYIIYSCIVVKN